MIKIEELLPNETVLVGKDRYKHMVLGVLNNLVFISVDSHFNEYWRAFHIDQLNRVGYTILSGAKKWAPKEGEGYYYVDIFGCVDYGLNTDSKSDSRLIEIGNCFKTEQEAKNSRIYKGYHPEEGEV